MITANTKVTALEILNECGVKKAEDVFGKMRVRIGGIAGINKPDHLIMLQPEVTNLEVIVGDKIYDLELSKGNKDTNKDVFEVSEHARKVLDAEGQEATKAAERLQAVKTLARKIIAAEDAEGEYEPSKAEAELHSDALDMVDAIREAQANPQVRDEDRPVTKVKSG